MCPSPLKAFRTDWLLYRIKQYQAVHAVHVHRNGNSITYCSLRHFTWRCRWLLWASVSTISLIRWQMSSCYFLHLNKSFFAAVCSCLWKSSPYRISTLKITLQKRKGSRGLSMVLFVLFNSAQNNPFNQKDFYHSLFISNADYFKINSIGDYSQWLDLY